jgi:hypothetical protein
MELFCCIRVWGRHLGVQKVFLTSIEIMEYMYQRYFAIVIAFCANMLYSLGAHVLMRRRA